MVETTMNSEFVGYHTFVSHCSQSRQEFASDSVTAASLLKKPHKIRLNKFKGQIGFIQQLTRRVASHLADTKERGGAVQKGRRS